MLCFPSIDAVRLRLLAPLTSVAALLGFVVVSLIPIDARACGGCFHPPPPPPPPDQPAQSPTVVTDHRMVLSLGTSSTTLWDQIEYAGDPSDFAWVLPTHGLVKVGVGANAFIDGLDQLTAPLVHAPNVICLDAPGGGLGGGNGGCNLACGPMSSSDSASPSDFSTPDTGANEDSGVVITGKSTVGPYDVVQIHGTDEGSIVGWLRKNAYVIPSDIEPILTQYVTEGFDFVAVRLSPGKGVQAMKPIRVTFEGKYPSLPLRMVAAGVGARVGIKLFVVGDGRWKTENFETFVIDPLGLTWDFATASSDYATTRAATAAKFPNGAFGLESSIDIARSSVPASDPIAPDAGPFDTGAIDSGAPDSSEADGEVIADASADASADAGADDGLDAPVDDKTTDLDLAFGTYPTRRVTRLRADLPTVALGIDLQLEADDVQTVLPVDMRLVKYKNETSVCPDGAQLSNVPSGAPATMLGLSAASCNTSAGDSNPIRLPLGVALGALVIALGRRAIRSSRVR